MTTTLDSPSPELAAAASRGQPLTSLPAPEAAGTDLAELPGGHPKIVGGGRPS